MEVPVGGTLEEGLEEGSLFTSLRTPLIQGPFSPEEVPRVGHQILRQADLELHSCIIWSTRIERF